MTATCKPIGMDCTDIWKPAAADAWLPARAKGKTSKRAKCAALGSAEALFLTGCAIARWTSLALATVGLNY
jgi:hypothetical protein